MILNNFFDKIYVINLKESLDRKNHILQEFKKNNIINYEFFEATHFDEKSVSDLLNSPKVISFPPCFRCLKNRCNCENNFLTKFQIANWLSYINLFNKILETKHELVLICEDDIVFTKNAQQICNTLLNKALFRKKEINMKYPLLIKMGAAFDYGTHLLMNPPTYIKNYSLSNPCFAVNRSMIKTFLYNLKVIDYHSDVYFHKQIPAKFNIQMLVMKPFPVYELSFVKNLKKFNSLVRPTNQIRRKEYKEFLFVTMHKLLEYIPIEYSKALHILVSNNNVHFNGTINYFYLLNIHDQSRFHFKNKIFIYDSFEKDSLIMKNDLKMEKSYLLTIIYNIITTYQLDIDKNVDSVLNHLENIYLYILKYFEDNEFLLININEPNILSKYEFINQYLSIYANLTKPIKPELNVAMLEQHQD